MNRSTASGYSGLQIALHWIVVVLVLFQLLFGDAMEKLFRAQLRGELPSLEAVLWGNLHIWSGASILVAVILRLVLRARRGPPLEESNRVLAALARGTHAAFYAVLMLLPITGGVAYYLELPAVGEVHQAGKPVLVILIALHVGAAFWHQFVRRDARVMRMIRPR